MFELQDTQNVYHRHIHAFSFRNVQKQCLRYSFKAKADVANKDKLYLLHARVTREEFLQWS